MEIGKKPTVAILGDFFHEGVSSQITNLGYDHFLRTLYNRTPKTWDNRCQEIDTKIESGEIKASILYLATPLFFQASKKEFHEVWLKLLATLKKTRSIIFVFEDNLCCQFYYYDSNGIPRDLDYVENELHKIEKAETEWHEALISRANTNQPDSPFPASPNIDEHIQFKLRSAHSFMTEAKENSQEISNFIETLHESEIEISTFRTRADVSAGIQSFLNAISQGIFFTIYVNYYQMYSEQFSDFIRIFARYLQEVEGVSFMVDTQTTSKGTTYCFKSKDGISTISNFSLAINRFDNFMTICKDLPKRAEELLLSKGIPRERATLLISEYLKKYQRLIIDIKHSFEQNKLLIQQQFENTVLESSLSGDPIGIVSSSAAFSAAVLTSPVSQNTRNLQVQKLFDQEELQFLQLAQKYGDTIKQIEIRTYIEQLKDKDLPIITRKDAKSKLLNFLCMVSKKAAKHAEDIGVKLLSTYLEKKIEGR